MGRPSKWSPEFREEAVRMYRESGESIAAVSRRLGLGPETFRGWVREDEVERGQRDWTTREEHAEIVKLRREVRRLEEEKLILQKAAAYFARDLGAGAGMRPAETCPGAIHVTDAKNDTRSWTLPPPPGPTVIPRSADLLRVELRATSAGVCVRWTTAAPAPTGTTFEFTARGPWIREASGAQVSHGYGFYLDLTKNGARATFGLARVGSAAPHVLRVRAGQTGSVVSTFLRKEWFTPPANQRDAWVYVYRVFSFEARVLSRPDASGNRRVRQPPLPTGGRHRGRERRLGDGAGTVIT